MIKVRRSSVPIMIYIKSLMQFTLAVIVLFIIYNIFWAANAYFIYTPYTENIPKDEIGLTISITIKRIYQQI